MTPRVAHDSEDLDDDSKSVGGTGSKVDELVTMQTQNVPALASSPYRQVDTSAIDPHKLKRKIDVRLLPWLTSRTFSTKAI